jgi:ATP-binding cassette, subfamily B, bacterial MsbA
MELFKRLVILARPYSVRFAFAMACMILVGLMTSAQAALVKPILDDIFLGKNFSALVWLPLAVIGAFLFKGAANYGQTILMSYIGLRIIANLRNQLYDHIQRQSLSFFTQHPTGLLMSRVTNDVISMQAAASEAITSLIRDTFTIIALVGFIFYTDWKLALIAMIVFPATIYPISKFGKKMRKVTTSSQETMGTLSSLLQETIAGTRIVKAFCMEKYESAKIFGRE